jgi:hypothetical protein
VDGSRRDRVAVELADGVAAELEALDGLEELDELGGAELVNGGAFWSAPGACAPRPDGLCASAAPGSASDRPVRRAAVRTERMTARL